LGDDKEGQEANLWRSEDLLAVRKKPILLLKSIFAECGGAVGYRSLRLGTVETRKIVVNIQPDVAK
jgi:hypothetical protein